MNKLLKWLLAGVVVVVIIIAIASFVLPKTIDPNNYKDELRAAVHAKTGRELTIGDDIQWSVFPWIGFDLSSVELGNRSGFGDQPMLSIGKAGVSVKLIPLFSRKIEIGKVSLTDVSVYLSQKSDGRNNWEDLSDLNADTRATPSESNAGFEALVISGIEVSNANVTWDDAGQIMQLKGLGLRTSSIEWGQSFDLEGGFSIDLTQPQLAGDVTFSGLVQPDADGTTYSIEGLDLGFEGTHGSADENGLTRLLATTKITGSSSQVEMRDLNISFGQSTLKGSLKAEGFERPKLAFDFKLDRLNLDDYFPETGEETDEADLTVDMFRGFTGGGTLDIEELHVSGLRATDVRLTMSSDGKGIRLFPLDAGFYDGQHQGDIKIDASGRRPVLTALVKLTKVQAGDVLKDLTGTARLQGEADFDLDIRTDLTNAKSTRQALAGKIGMVVFNGAIVGIDVAETIRTAQSALGQATASSGKTERDPKTDFSELSMTGVINRGILTSDDLMMRSPLLRVTGKGTINLVDDTIDYRVEPVLVKSLEGQGSQASDALGGVPVPVRLSGNLYEPDISVDIAAAISGSQKEKIARKKDELTDKLMGKLLGGKSDSDTGDRLNDSGEGEAKEKDDPARSLIKGLFGSKKDKNKKEDDGGGVDH